MVHPCNSLKNQISSSISRVISDHAPAAFPESCPFLPYFGHDGWQKHTRRLAKTDTTETRSCQGEESMADSCGFAEREGVFTGLFSYIWQDDNLIERNMRTINILVAGLGLLMAVSCGQPKTEDNQMNETIQTIMARRSIRQYKDVAVGRDTLNTIMECGINAPNGQNKQSWDVRIVDNPALLAEMSEAMGQAHGEFAKGCFRGAPVMVFIARDLGYDFSSYDCGLMAENIMLSAWSLGVGSIALGSPVRFLTDNDLCKPYVDRLGFSEGYELCLCVGLGYADESPEAKPRNMGKVKFVE